MPAFYALTAPKLFAVIDGILNDKRDAEHVLKSLYVELYKRSHENGFRPTWTDLLKLARRYALDFKMAGGPIKRARANSIDGQSAAGSGKTAQKSSKPNGLGELRRKLLKRILDPNNPTHNKAAEKLGSTTGIGGQGGAL